MKNKRILLLIPLVFLIAFSIMLFKSNKKIEINNIYTKKLNSYSDVLDNENNIENTENVKFDAYFLINGNKKRGNSLALDQFGKLNIDLNVTGDVVLKNIKILFINSNVRVGYNGSFESQISLKDIDGGTNKDIRVTIKPQLTNDFSSYSKSNKVVLTGTLVENGNEIEITKEVSYIMDWYSTGIDAFINRSYYTDYEIKDDTIYVSYDFRTYANPSSMIKSVNLTANVALLNGIEPKNVTVEGTNYTSNYDPNTRKLTVKREAELNETMISNSAYDYVSDDKAINNFKIIIEYPISAGYKDASLPLNVNVFYEQYNNPDSDYQNVFTSNTARYIFTAVNKADDIVESINEGGPIPYLISARTDIYSTAIDKTAAFNLYDEIDADKTTLFKYNLETRFYYTLGKVNKIIVWDNDYDLFNGAGSMMNIVKYKSIEFRNDPTSVFGPGGYIKMFDGETNELLHIFTSSDWNKKYEFDSVVRKLYFETSEVTDVERCYPSFNKTTGKYSCTTYSTALNISVVKEIDNEMILRTYNKDEFNSLSSVTTKVNTNMETENESVHYLENESLTTKSTDYELPKSSGIELSLSRTDDSSITTMPTNEEIPYKLTLRTGRTPILQSVTRYGWRDGEFIIEFPKEIISVNVKDVDLTTFGIGEDISLDGYELKYINGQYILKIFTLSDEPVNYYNIEINADLYADPRSSSVDTTINAYGLNKYYDLSDWYVKDKYDMDNDGSTDDYVNHDSASLYITADDEIKTVTSLKIYDENNTEIETVAPNTAEINPVSDKDKAIVEIGLYNHSSNSVQNIRIIGKTGYVGNTYQLNNTNLGSEFDAPMTDRGIIVPDGLINYTTVYYSTKNNPTDDINNPENDWKLKENVTDFDDIKSYMIIINDYTVRSNANISFNYEVKIPMTTNLLYQSTYFTHAIYYNKNVDGDIVNASPIEQRKTRLMITRKYNLELTNYKTASTNPIRNTAYILTDEDGNVKFLKTNSSGKYVLEGLYVGKAYKLVQRSVKYPFILDSEEKEFTVINNSSDELELINLVGTYKSNTIENSVLKTTLENETRYDVTIKNTDLDTNELIPLSRFTISGKGMGEGKNVITNSNGELTLNGLYLDEIYTVTQTRSSEHLTLSEPFTFMLRRNPKTQEIKVSRDIKLQTQEEYGEPVALNNTPGLTRDGVFYELTSKTTANAVDESYIELDLTDYIYQYKFVYDIYKSYYARNTYGYKNKVAVVTDFNHIPDLPEEETGYDDDHNTGTITTAYSYNSTTNSFDIIPLEGGRKYYIYMYAKNAPYNYSDDKYMYFIFRDLKKIDDSTTDSLYYLSKENVPVYSNSNVLQTIIEPDTIDIPKLIINVRSKRIPNYTLEVNKVSADSKVPLSGAQYKITGSGLPYGGTYIKTDENGKATIELRKATSVLTPETYNEVYINGFNYEEVNIPYKIQEVVPPVGYQLDNGEISFSFMKIYDNNNCILDNKKYKCVVDENTSYNEKIVYSNERKQFVDYEIDESTNTLKVTMYDYPLVTIVKRDDETQELLPDTLFSLYSVSYGDLGKEVLTPAKDSKGNILGQLVTIGDNDYYVLSTDENGKLNIDLSSGEYKAVEVQAVDEKYDITNQYYYFSVGKTQEYTPGKIQYLGSILEKFNGFFYYSESYDLKLDDIIPTSDGGWIVAINDLNEGTYDYGWDGRQFNPDHVIAIVKYDKNLNKEWQSDVKFQFVGSITQYRYYDDKDRVEYDNPHEVRYVTGRKNVYVDETDDGYYVTSYSMGVIKLDKQGNRLWQNQDYAQSELYYYTAICDKDTGKVVNSNEYVPDYNIIPYDSTNPHIQKDDDTYYCSTYDVYDATTETVGGIVKWMVYNSDGPSEPMPELKYDDTQYNSSNEFEYEYDDEGHIIGTKKVWTILTPVVGQKNNILRFGANGRFYASTVNRDSGTYIKNLTATKDGGVTLLQSDSLRWQPDGAFILSDGTLRIFTSSRESFRVKNSECEILNHVFENRNECNEPIPYYRNNDKLFHYSSDGKFLSVDDLGRLKYLAIKKYNEEHNTNLEINYYSWNTIDDIKTFENGDLLYISKKNGIIRLRYNLEKLKYEPIYYIPPDVILSGGSETYGKIEVQIVGNSFVIAERRYDQSILGGLIYYVDENGNYREDVRITAQEDSLNYKRANGERNLNGFYRLSNGNYLVYGQINRRQISSSYGLQSNEIVLGLENEYVQKSLNIEDDKIYMIIYEVNPESKILWYKLFDITNNYSSSAPYNEYWTYTPIRYNKNSNEVLLTISKGDNLTLTNVEDSNESYTAKGNLIVFSLHDDTTPEAPEAYTIEVPNKRKTFKINIESGEGGKTEVLNGNNVTYTLNNESRDIETIKYGDNSIYTIKAKGNDGYIIDKVLLNGEEHSFSVTDDGSITLDGIDDVKENKKINITFKPGSSMVIVHHYIKDTETKIASDEIISGTVLMPYETEPTLNELYSLEKDSDGEYIFPDNYQGVFKSNPIVVTYYYVENNVNLKTNYYKKNTTIELAPSKTERKLLGSSYKTSPMNIEFYELVNVIGNEEGTLTKENTEVTYMYQEVSNVTLTIKYIDKDTEKELSDTITKELKRHDKYETSSIEIPLYRLVDKTDNYKGKAENQNIEVIYYYEKIKSNITVKYLEKDTNKELSDSILITVNLNDNYITQSKVIDNYKLIDKTNNTSGKAESEEIEVIYYYEYIEQPKVIEEVEKPTPQIKNTVSFIIKSTLEIENEEKEKQVLGAIEEEVGDNPLCIKIVSIIALIIIVAGVILYNRKELN